MRAYDATRVFALLAGIAKPSRQLTPVQLIETYCTPRLPRPGAELYAGFAGWDGERGFGDGYDYMGALLDGGWHAIPGVGEWPYLSYMAWLALADDPGYYVARYCEGDLEIEAFASEQGFNGRLRALRRPGREKPGPD